MRVESIGFLEFCIKEIENPGLILWDISEESFEHRPGSFHTCYSSSVPGNKFIDVCQPNFMKTWPLEVSQGELKHSEGLLEIGVFPQKVGIVE